jgi:hypothetical protein
MNINDRAVNTDPVIIACIPRSTVMVHCPLTVAATATTMVDEEGKKSTQGRYLIKRRILEPLI